MLNQISDELKSWCEERVGAEPRHILFRLTHLSTVLGLELSDGRRVVLKVRPSSARLLGCFQVQQQLWAAGFPCPQPLAGPDRLGSSMVTAEAFAEGGELLEPGEESPRLFAEALAWLVSLAPEPDSVSALDPTPPWVSFDHQEHGPWPIPDDIDTDLNTVPGPPWLDDVQRRVRARLLGSPLPRVIGHCDWWSQNLRWVDRQLHVVHDWDSVVALPEAALAGAASAAFAEDGIRPTATLDESAEFLRAYAEARGRPWTREEEEVCWAEGLLLDAFNAKKDFARGGAGPSMAHLVTEWQPRLRLAGA